MAEEQYFLKRRDAVKGPFSLQKLQSLLAENKLKANDLVGASDDGPWERMAAVHKSIRAGQPLALTSNTAVTTEGSEAAPMSEPVNSMQTKCADCGQSLLKVTGTRCPRCFEPLPVSTTTEYLQTHKPRNAAGNKAATDRGDQQAVDQLDNDSGWRPEEVVTQWKSRCAECGNEFTGTADSQLCCDCSTQLTCPKAAAIAVPTKLSPQNPNLIECTDCGKAISKRAASCPHCGSPVENSTAATASGDAVDACCAESNVNCSDSGQETGMEPVLDVIKHDVTKLQRIAKILEGIDV